MLDILIKDIREIIPKEYNFHIDVSSIGIDVIFGEECFEPEAFKITCGWEGFAYLHTNDMNYELGLSAEELTTITNVATYLDGHKEYIDKLMGEFK